MKNIKINHQFTLKEILQDILKSGNKEDECHNAHTAMENKLKEYIGMIK